MPLPTGVLCPPFSKANSAFSINAVVRPRPQPPFPSPPRAISFPTIRLYLPLPPTQDTDLIVTPSTFSLPLNLRPVRTPRVAFFSPPTPRQVVNFSLSATIPFRPPHPRDLMFFRSNPTLCLIVCPPLFVRMSRYLLWVL